jgi:GTP1/Obg family GTP-binding protein
MGNFKTYSYIKKQLQTKKTFNLRGDLQPILDVLENIRAKIDNTKIDIPGVVVTGAQSSGKSSIPQTPSFYL